MRTICSFVLALYVIGCNQAIKPDEIPEGMAYIEGGTYMQGAVEKDQMAMGHENPPHKVKVSSFYIDIHEVTNAQYRAFVEATGYLTLAERPIVWEDLKKQLPKGTPSRLIHYFSPVHWSLKDRPQLFIICMIFRSGGSGELVRIGGIQRDQTVLLKVKKIIQ